jgi:hypothetical protein
MSERQSDPRKRPPDPAGTQPKVEPESLRGVAPGERHGLSASAQPALLTGAPDTLELDPDGAGAVPAARPAQPPAPTTAFSTGAANPHAPRFQFLFGALGALAIAALALAFALLRAPAATPEPPWSAWAPSQDGTDPAQQIADYVAPQYRLADGKQIVQVVGGPPALKGQPLTVGVVKSGKSPAALEGNSVLYQLCGDGTDCSIKQGKPSTQRALLLGREALELALYTFRYVSGVDQVLVTIPPPPPTGSTAKASSSALSDATGVGGAATGSTAVSGSTRTANHALLFSQQNLAPELGRPLGETLSAVTPQVSQMDGWPDAVAVKALTEPRLYDYVISETQSTGPVMLLEPPSLGG